MNMFQQIECEHMKSYKQAVYESGTKTVKVLLEFGGLAL